MGDQGGKSWRWLVSVIFKNIYGEIERGVCVRVCLGDADDSTECQ